MKYIKILIACFLIACNNQSEPAAVVDTIHVEGRPAPKLAQKIGDQNEPIITSKLDTIFLVTKDTTVTVTTVTSQSQTYPVTRVVIKPYKPVINPPIDTVKPPTSSKYLLLPISAPQIHTNKTNLVIENLRFTNPAGDNLRFNNCSNVIIRNCYFGNSSGEGVSMYGGSNITIERCLFSNNRTMIYAEKTTGNIKIINNQWVNADGPMPRGQYVQLNTITGAGNLIEGNRGESWIGESYPADLISIYNSQGTVASPVTVRNNIFRGGGPMPSGGGIMSGDMGGRYALIEGNKLVNPGQYAIAAAGGQFITIRNNQIYAEQRPWNNIAIAIWNEKGVTCSNINVTANRAHYICGNASNCAVGQQNLAWTSGCTATVVQTPTPITLAEMNVPVHLIDFITPSELLTIRK